MKIALKKSIPSQASPFKGTPFPQLQKAYEKAVEIEQQLPYEDRVRDWIHVKPSTNGSSLPKKTITLVLPVGGGFLQI